MAATYEEALRVGGARIEYVAHIHGFPWAIATHPAVAALIDAANGSNYPLISLRREMFGNEFIAVAGNNIYPADYVQILHGLEPPGEQTVKLSPSMGMIDAGGFKLEVPDTDYPLALTHRPENPVYGLDGVHTIADYRYDDTIRWSPLTVRFLKGDPSLYVASDAVLHARILARVAAGVPCYLWAGSECIAVNGSTDDGVELKIDAVRGIWHSREQAHYLEDFDGAYYPVSDAPLGGAVGKPVTVWGLLLDDNGTTILDAVRARCGRVSTDIASDDGMTTIDCDGWTDWLKSPLKNTPFKAPLTGYHISRPDAAIPATEHDCAGHIVLHSGGVGAVAENIWFCDPGAELFFAEYEDFAEHVRAELALLSVGPGTYNPAALSHPLVLNGSGTKLITLDPDGAYITGVLPWAFRWGRIIKSLSDYDSDNSILRRMKNGDWYQAGSVTWTDTLQNSPVMFSHFQVAWEPTFPYNFYGLPCAAANPDYAYTYGCSYTIPPYFYQWPWHHDDDARASSPEGDYICQEVKRGKIPIAYIAALGISNSMAISTEFDHTKFMDGDVIRAYQLIDGGRGMCAGNGTVVGSNYVTFDNPDGYTSEDDENTPAVSLYNGKKVTKGYCWCPVYDAGQLDQTIGILASARTIVDPWWIFAEVLGNDIGGVYCSELHHADQVPDVAWNIATAGIAPNLFVSSQMPTIDFKMIGGLFSQIVSNEWYKLTMPVSGNVTVAAAFEGFLLAHGVSPTWEFDAAWRMWRLKFRPFAVANSTEATLFSRVLDESNIRREGYTTEHVRENIYNRIDFKGSWNGKEHRVMINTVGRSALGNAGGRQNTLAINDYVTHFGNVEDLADDPLAMLDIQSHFGAAILPRVAQPAPTVTTKTLPSTTAMIGVGVVAVVDDDYMRDPHTNRMGVSRAALITETRSFLYGKENRVSLRFFASETRGYVPSLQIKNGDETGTDPDVVYFGGAATDPANNVFGFPYWPLTDLAYFDCYRMVGGVVSLDTTCACADYSVMLIERYTDTPAVYRGLRIRDINLAAGTFTLYGAGFDAAYVPAEHVLLFEAWDDANLQPCQRRWLYHADEDKRLIDSAAVETIGKGWT